jgi:hypothetical protein
MSVVSRFLFPVVLAGALPLAAEHASERLKEATQVLNEIMSAPDNGIPQDLLQ